MPRLTPKGKGRSTRGTRKSRASSVNLGGPDAADEEKASLKRGHSPHVDKHKKRKHKEKKEH